MSRTPDVLTGVLESAGFAAEEVGMGQLVAPWAIRFPGDRACALHCLLEGACTLTFDGDHASYRLAAGAVVVLLVDQPHVIADRHGRLARSVKDHPALERRGRVLSARSSQRGTPTRMVSAAFRVTGVTSEGIFAALPSRVVLAPQDGGAVAELRPFVDLLSRELAAERPGYQATALRLAEALFVAALRHAGTAEALNAGLMRGLAEPRLSRAIHAMHRTPERRWTVPELAQLAGMSRSSFAQCFHETLGKTPHGYLTAWRVARAAQLLREGDTSVLSVAAAVGFASESAFSRVFSAKMGAAPGRYRRLRRA